MKMAHARQESIIMRRLLNLFMSTGPRSAMAKFRTPSAKVSHRATVRVNPDWVKMATE